MVKERRRGRPLLLDFFADISLAFLLQALAIAYFMDLQRRTPLEDMVSKLYCPSNVCILVIKMFNKNFYS
jgi:hypothetical protein